MSKPVFLIILDGWGENPNLEGNAIAQAKTPNIDKMSRHYPQTLLQASGVPVGLPWGEMGNSEVGHLTLGAGRIIYQSLPRITLDIQNGNFFQNEAFLAAIAKAKNDGSKLHFIGLASNGGVHSSMDHLYALCELAKKSDVQKTCLHLFMDGRDTPPRSGIKIVQALEDRLKENEKIRIASICGRYFAMDRNDNWDRTQRAYNLLVLGEGEKEKNAVEAIEKSYNQNITDEFMEPIIIENENGDVDLIDENDSVIFFNYREDRARQITKAFVLPTFSKFERGKYLSGLEFVTMTKYEENLPVRIAYGPQEIKNPLGEVLSNQDVRQLRMAETEKYAHVTYFFNGGREDPFPGEDRLLIPSQSVSTYDKMPEMSAYQITDRAIKELGTGKYGFVLINFANADMVGHTGNLKASISAIETIDECLGKIIPEILKIGGHIFITADHGNAEEIINPRTEEIDTEHSTFPVPIWYLNSKNQRQKSEAEIIGSKSNIGGLLSDVAPTILDVMRIQPPKEMTGQSLLGTLK